MTSGTLCRTTQARSSGNRLFDGWTTRFTAHAAASGSFDSAASIRLTQSSRSAEVRALGAGKLPITPAREAAITISGLDTRNIGAAIAGRRNCALALVEGRVPARSILSQII